MLNANWFTSLNGAKKNRRVATRLQPAAPTQFVRLLVACALCTYTSGDAGMRKASTWMRAKGMQTPSPSPDLVPAQNNKTVADNLHGLEHRTGAHHLHRLFSSFWSVKALIL